MLLITPYLLLVFGLVIIYLLYNYYGAKIIIWSVAAYMITLTIEIVGVRTGIIFGTYSYGDVLGRKVFQVPLIIGFNWIIILLGAASIINRLKLGVFYGALLTASIAVLFDIVLEPAAVKLNYWTWHSNAIPVQNYLAWSAIAFISYLSLIIANLRPVNLILENYVLAQFIFFIFLNFM